MYEPYKYFLDELLPTGRVHHNRSPTKPCSRTHLYRWDSVLHLAQRLLRRTSMNNQAHLKRAWNCNMRLSYAVRYLEKKGISKTEVVQFFKATCKAVGYSGSLYMPRPYNNKELAFSYDSSVEISPEVHYCEKRQLWWKNGTVYSKDSARHNGIIGAGADLRQLLSMNQ